MNLFNLDGMEIALNEFSKDSIVVMRITKKMTNEEFIDFCKSSSETIGKVFEERGIKVLVCPDWIEFKEWQ